MGAWARTVDGIKREVMQGERHSTGTSHITSLMFGHRAFLSLAVMRFHVACPSPMVAVDAAVLVRAIKKAEGEEESAAVPQVR